MFRINYFRLGSLVTFVISCVSILTVGYGSTKLKPTFLMQQETQWLIQALEKAHYKKVSINELNATKFLNGYLQKLDKQKLFFTQNEVNEFYDRYAPTL